MVHQAMIAVKINTLADKTNTPVERVHRMLSLVHQDRLHEMPRDE